MDKSTAARKLSGALGKRVHESEIELVLDEPDPYDRISVKLFGGVWWTLMPGNEAEGGPTEVEYFRNGVKIDFAEGMSKLVEKIKAKGV